MPRHTPPHAADDSAYTPEHLSRWTHPQNYVGETWESYFVFLGRDRDSDDLTESNFAVGLREIGGESETVTVVRESHWAVGWVEWIAIHESDIDALRKADRLTGTLSDYPVLDEEDWSEREMETAHIIWRDCYDASERVEYIRRHRYQFDFHDFRDLLACVRGEYFAGYASELIS